jgi:hypothetical protein
VTEEPRARALLAELVGRGATGYTISPCSGAGRTALRDGTGPRNGLVRVEMLIAPEKFQPLVDCINREVRSGAPITVCSETVEVFRADHF